jgi:hypothetical protein
MGKLTLRYGIYNRVSLFPAPISRPYGGTLKVPEKPQNSAIPRTFPRTGWNPLEREISRHNARKMALSGVNYSPEFTEECARHGITLFDTETGACLSCLSDALPRTGLPERVRYLSAYAVLYPATCPTHGQAMHYMKSNRCSKCYTARGNPRSNESRNTARLAARASGATTYMGTCGTHGTVAHHTIRGKCLTCYNSLGYPRKGPR